MAAEMMRRSRTVLLTLVATTALLVSSPAFGQAPAQPTAQSATAPPSRLWITAGGSSTTFKGDCSTCSGDPTYNHAGSLLANVGFRGNSRVDGGVELFWVPAKTVAGEVVRTTMILGVGQFRPWVQHGFFLKGGMGIAFVRNFIYDATNDVTPPFTTNAMALTYGAGWEFRTRTRVGLQVYGTHHIVALGDLTFNDGTVDNVVGNFWSIGASFVIR
jgi:hypothetical protein